MRMGIIGLLLPCAESGEYSTLTLYVEAEVPLLTIAGCPSLVSRDCNEMQFGASMDWNPQVMMLLLLTICLRNE
jgi:hypothetical protein